MGDTRNGDGVGFRRTLRSIGPAVSARSLASAAPPLRATTLTARPRKRRDARVTPGRKQHDALDAFRLKASSSLRRGCPRARCRRLAPTPWQADARGKPPSNRHGAQRRPNGNAGTRSFRRPIRIRAARRGLRRNLRKPDTSWGCPSSSHPLMPETAYAGLVVDTIGGTDCHARAGRHPKVRVFPWAQRDSDPRLRPCEGRTLPLSYAPKPGR
jgi:hypothetical protein